MPHRNSFYSSGSMSPGSRSESPLAVQTSPKLALSPSHHQPQTSPQASSPSLTHHAALRGVQSSPLGMVVPGMIPFYGIPSPAGSRSPRSPPMLSPIVATPNNNGTNSGNTNPTGGDAPLNLTKPRGSSQGQPWPAISAFEISRWRGFGPARLVPPRCATPSRAFQSPPFPARPTSPATWHVHRHQEGRLQHGGATVREQPLRRTSPHACFTRQHGRQLCCCSRSSCCRTATTTERKQTIQSKDRQGENFWHTLKELAV